ncbi:hypothetical protein NF556_15865 [Ornithinimicrobium faecis]|uniref:Uncharacterized protein n=1 Tax=Ornithinimicrobium faecis TaxID=2934158 RepID=A0ABY4YQQ8_9MICO|nr:DUF6636 domain-containing protein [Ornithinimicrobium sp. HY1793]USQ79081.1 hypothetical protein NF556_15865 [Ornithinimicrobium sp. HY1793]
MTRGGFRIICLAAVLLAGCTGAAPEVEEVDDPAAETTAGAPEPTAEEPTAAEPTDAEPTGQESATETPPEDAGEGEVIDVEPGAAFLSPSTNIACFLAEDEDGAYVGCDIQETDAPLELPPPDNVAPRWQETLCEEPVDQGSTILLSEGEVFWNCSFEPIMIAADVEYGGSWVGDGPTAELWDGTPAAVLAYGQTLRTATHECTSARDGVTCQEIGGEHGLTLSRSGIETWG